MTGATHRPAPATLWAAFASLIPWAAFLLAAAVADRSTSPGGLLAAAPAYLGFVALPSAAPLVAARTGLLRLVTATVMTAVAAGAGLFLGTSDDAQAGLAVLWVPLVAIPLATVLWVGNRIADRRATTADPEQPIPTVADRVAALVIDSAILGAVLVVPLTAMSHAQQEVAAGVVGIGVGALYMATLVVARRQTLGQRLLRLAVVDSQTLGPCPFVRALLRSMIVVVEAAAVPTIVLSLPAVAELMSVAATGRSLTDRLLGTSVVTVPVTQ